MQLLYAPASPYARKVMMLLHHNGLLDQTELLRTDPFNNSQYRALNPLGKVPTLIDGDTVLFDSPLICEYLDDKAEKFGMPRVFRRDSEYYYREQKTHVIANGMLDAAVSSVYELRREPTQQSNFWLVRWQQTLHAALETIDLAHLGDGENTHIGTIATCATLGYLDFRLADLNWRQWNSRLAAWYAAMEQLPWVAMTREED